MVAAALADGVAQLHSAQCGASPTTARLHLAPQVQQYIKGRQRLGLPEAARGDPVLEYVAGLEGLTRTQLSTLVDMCLDKYETKRVDPGGWTRMLVLVMLMRD